MIGTPIRAVKGEKARETAISPCKRIRGPRNSAIGEALGANSAARPSEGVTSRGMSNRVDVDNGNERAYLTVRFHAWANKA